MNITEALGGLKSHNEKLKNKPCFEYDINELIEAIDTIIEHFEPTESEEYCECMYFDREEQGQWCKTCDKPIR